MNQAHHDGPRERHSAEGKVHPHEHGCWRSCWLCAMNREEDAAGVQAQEGRYHPVGLVGEPDPVARILRVLRDVRVVVEVVVHVGCPKQGKHRAMEQEESRSHPAPRVHEGTRLAQDLLPGRLRLKSQLRLDVAAGN